MKKALATFVFAAFAVSSVSFAADPMAAAPANSNNTMNSMAGSTEAPAPTQSVRKHKTSKKKKKNKKASKKGSKKGKKSKAAAPAGEGASSAPAGQ